MDNESGPASEAEYRYSNKAKLPDGVAHGSMRAVRLGCCCTKCMERRKKAAKRGLRF